MSEISITLSGPPVPWTPSRVVHGKYAFSPRYREKEHHQWEVASQYKGEFIENDKAIELVFEFHMPIPSSTSKKKRELMIKRIIPHTKRPDCTNMQKYAEDCLVGIILRDDSQVIRISSEKFYSETPKTIIYILEHE